MNLLRHDFQEEIEEIMRQIKQNAENRVLYQYIDNPPISQLRVSLLYLFYGSTESQEPLFITIL